MASDTYRIIFTGVGGKGVLLAGKLLAQAALKDNKNVSWLPSYMASMRGGPCECTVIISEEQIVSPMVYGVDAIVAMDPNRLGAYEGRVYKGGLIIVENAGVRQKAQNNEVRVFQVPALEMASGIGSPQVANIVLLGVFVKASGVITPFLVEQTLKNQLGRDQKVFTLNKEALNAGVMFVERGRGTK